MSTAKPTVDPITMEVLRGRFDAVADEMEYAILRSAYSTIVTEALDATAAVCDERGRTVAQACAIPVHLGTLTELGRRFAQHYPAGTAKPGDLYIINDPYQGGTHLPDIAVAAPVFSETVQQSLRVMGVQPDIGIRPQIVANAVEESF